MYGDRRPPPVPRHGPEYGHQHNHHLCYVLMHDKKGWTSLAASAGGASGYLRVHHGAELPDVDVEKGTLVEVDPTGDFDPRTNISVNVVCVERPEIKLSLLTKELMAIEDGQFQRLLPLKPSERYDVLTDERRFRMFSAGVGDTVYCVTSAQFKEARHLCLIFRLATSTHDLSLFFLVQVGMVQYVGRVKALGPGVFYGIELLVGWITNLLVINLVRLCFCRSIKDSDRGMTDGRMGNQQYFVAAPLSSVFVNISKLYYYDDRQPRLPARSKNSRGLLYQLVRVVVHFSL